MLGAWPIAHRWKYLATSVRAWKLLDSPTRTIPRSGPHGTFPEEIPQSLLRQLLEKDADCAEALWALDQPEGSLDRRAMLRHALTALDHLPSACAQFRKQLPARAYPTLEQLELTLRKKLNPNEAYNMVPGRDPESV
jgi:hypothetical protein